MNMILYHMAKLMEERETLANSISRTNGDAAFLLQRKEKVEEQMLEQTRVWASSFAEQRQLAPAEEADDPEVFLPVQEFTQLVGESGAFM